MVDKNVYPFIIKYFNIKNTINDIVTLSHEIFSTSIDFFIKLIIKKSINKLSATGTTQSLTIFPIPQMLISWTLEKSVNFCTEPIKSPESSSIPKALNLKL